MGKKEKLCNLITMHKCHVFLTVVEKKYFLKAYKICVDLGNNIFIRQKFLPTEPTFQLRNRKKSLGAKSEE
jgi:hypothetical protein